MQYLIKLFLLRLTSFSHPRVVPLVKHLNLTILVTYAVNFLDIQRACNRQYYLFTMNYFCQTMQLSKYTFLGK